MGSFVRKGGGCDAFLLVLLVGGAFGIGCTALSGVADLKSGSESAANTTTSGGTPVPLPDGAVVIIGEDGGIISSSSSSSSSSSGNPIPDDASADSPSPPLGYCASQNPAPTLCSDFDDGVFPGPWTPHTTNGAATALDTAIFRSGNRSAHFTFGGGGTGASYFSKAFTQMATTSVRVGFSVRPTNVQTAGATEYELMTLHLGSIAGNAYEVQLERINGMLNLEEERPLADGTTSETNRPLNIPSPLGQWMRIDVTITLAAQSSSVTVAAEGSLPQTFAASAHMYNTAAPSIFIGYDAAQASALDIHFDDIVVDIK